MIFLSSFKSNIYYFFFFFFLSTHTFHREILVFCVKSICLLVLGAVVIDLKLLFLHILFSTNFRLLLSVLGIEPSSCC